MLARFTTMIAFALIDILLAPLLFFRRFGRRRLPSLPRQVVATLDGQPPIRIRSWSYVRSVYELMTDAELIFLGDLYYAQQEYGLMPGPEESQRARKIINVTVVRWLDTEMGWSWRTDNFR